MAHGRRKRGHHEGGHENAERWLLTYADLITLLMVFFVVLYSMSSHDAVKFQAISAALQQAFNLDVMQGMTKVGLTDQGALDMAKPVDDLVNNNDVPEVQKLQSSIDAALQSTANQQTPDVSVGTDKDGVVVRLSGSYLFDSGRAELKPNSLALLDAIANEIKLLPNEIRVDGHTDSIPIDSPRYPTNWELSAARALAVTRYFTDTDGIQATRLIAAGFGEFHPIAPNDTREHRAMNRRVEIHILSSTVAAAGPTPTVTPQPTGATEYLEP